jgi:hypothetical protein
MPQNENTQKHRASGDVYFKDILAINTIQPKLLIGPFSFQSITYVIARNEESVKPMKSIISMLRVTQK